MTQMGLWAVQRVPVLSLPSALPMAQSLRLALALVLALVLALALALGLALGLGRHLPVDGDWAGPLMQLKGQTL